MKKKLLFFIVSLLLIFALSGCSNSETVSETVSSSTYAEETNDELLPFGFTAREYFENFSNFSSFSDIVIDEIGLTNISNVYGFWAERNADKEVQFTILTDPEGYVLNISISHIPDSCYLDIIVAALSATDMNLDSEVITNELNLKNPPADPEDLRAYVSCGIWLSSSYGRFLIQRDPDTKSDYHYAKIHSNPEQKPMESVPETGGISFDTKSSDSETTEAAPTETEPPSPSENITMGQRNALSSAKNYLNIIAFSYSGLISQLEYEGFTNEEATYAADNCGADWMEQALKKAKDYLNTSPFSYSGLIGQLEYEGFSTEEATYGVDNCGADWMEQAAKSAQNYIDLMSFSRSGLIDQLEYEGFTAEQAEYGASAVGY